MKQYQTTYEIEKMGSILFSEIKDEDIRMLHRDGDMLRLLYHDIAYDAKIKEFDYESKSVLVNVNGYDFRTKMVEPLDHLVKDLGFLSVGKHSVKEVKSPMPGLVVQIFVSPGQEVAEGEKLLTLEAMKMENIIKAAGSGIIKSVLIEKGNSVEKNQIMIEFE
jgi:biotin carboxyl carrier protein